MPLVDQFASLLGQLPPPMMHDSMLVQPEQVDEGKSLIGVVTVCVQFQTRAGLVCLREDDSIHCDVCAEQLFM